MTIAFSLNKGKQKQVENPFGSLNNFKKAPAFTMQYIGVPILLHNDLHITEHAFAIYICN